MNNFFLGLLISLLKTGGKTAVAALLDKEQARNPDLHATIIIVAYRTGKVQGQKLVDDSSNDWDNDVQEELMELFEEQFEKHGVGVPDVVIRNQPVLPNP